MTKKNNDKFNIDDLLSSIYNETLKEIFDRRVTELDLSATNVSELLEIDPRALTGILTGTKKHIDFTNLIKIANFLQLPKEDVIRLYLSALETNFKIETASSPDSVEFIKTNFDLATLKKAKFINTVTDFKEIEKKLVDFLGLDSIFDYKKPTADVAFSAGAIPKNDLNRSLWIDTALRSFKLINNPNSYDRHALLEYFPGIRWHSINVELGLINIIRDLYKLGVTVIYQSQLSSVNLRGATVNVNDKPCIVLTDYRGWYPTLWFALIHELHHVIFDFEQIKRNEYHISNADSMQLTVMEKEEEANNFAREYLFSMEKSKAIKPYLNNTAHVYEFAKNNHVHPSFIYVFNARDIGDKDRMAYARANRHNPDFRFLIEPLSNPWENPMPLNQFIKSIKYKLYN
jgi:HTH-type transcriptional regulator/antitoxin HigA